MSIGRSDERTSSSFYLFVLSFTFRTDIRKRHGSRTPVDALADILQTNGNLAPHRTVCCWTSSLEKEEEEMKGISTVFTSSAINNGSIINTKDATVIDPNVPRNMAATAAASAFFWSIQNFLFRSYLTGVDQPRDIKLESQTHECLVHTPRSRFYNQLPK